MLYANHLLKSFIKLLIMPTPKNKRLNQQKLRHSDNEINNSKEKKKKIKRGNKPQVTKAAQEKAFAPPVQTLTLAGSNI